MRGRFKRSMLLFPHWAAEQDPSMVQVSCSEDHQMGMTIDADLLLKQWKVDVSPECVPCMRLPSAIVELICLGKWHHIICLESWISMCCSRGRLARPFGLWPQRKETMPSCPSHITVLSEVPTPELLHEVSSFCRHAALQYFQILPGQHRLQVQRQAEIE